MSVGMAAVVDNFDARGSMGDLVVITPHASVARWARSIGRDTGPLGTHLRWTPRVVHVSARAAEKLLDKEHPELAFFAAWAVQHRHGAAARRVVRRALELSGQLPESLRRAQFRAILNVVSRRML